MEINLKIINPIEFDCDGLIIGLFSETDDFNPVVKQLDQAIKGKISSLISDGEVAGKPGEITVIHTVGEIKPKRIILAGLGKREELDTNQLREAFSKAVKRIRTIGKNIAIIPPLTKKFDVEDVSCSIVEGILLGLYKFTKYLTSHSKGKEENTIESITFTIPADYGIDTNGFKMGIEYGTIVSKNVNIAKDICNEPSNYMTPELFAQYAKKLFGEGEIKCHVLDEKELAANNMNLVLAVGQGSKNPPRCVVLEYIKNKDYPTVGLVGKGITFDTGGVMLKQDKATLFEMKRDLTGGAIALGAIKSLQELNFPLNCVAVIPLAENAIDRDSCKPGDIFYSMSGKSVEIFDTDCEGRLILVDAFTYIQKYYSPKIIIDMATLLNLSSILGEDRIPFFTNCETLIPKLKEAAELSGERVWQFPIDKKYSQRIQSHFADRKNRSYKKPQFISMGLFMEDFIDDGTDWFHLDLAGVDTKYGDTSYLSRGSTAYSLRLVTRFVFSLLEGYLSVK